MIKRAFNTQRSTKNAIEQLFSELNQPNLAGVIFFCSTNHDLQIVSDEINRYFKCPVVGCTAAGEIGDLYQKKGISGVSFSAEAFKFNLFLAKNLTNYHMLDITVFGNSVKQHIEESRFDEHLGVLLIDGLSMAEDRIIASAFNEFPNLPIIGGSAGDDLQFDKTYVFAEGEFHNDAAVFIHLQTSLDFEIFKLQHFVPSDIDFIVTDADPSRRIVYEINGEPAAKEYAQLLDLSLEELTPQAFSMNPLVLQIRDDWYVRSIQQLNSDNSLSFYCAIENGLPLTIAKGTGIVSTLQDKVNYFKTKYSEIQLTLGFDCILRRLEMFEKNYVHEIEQLLHELKFLGFSTYGEQFNYVHVNQTLTGVIFGKQK